MLHIMERKYFKITIAYNEFLVKITDKSYFKQDIFKPGYLRFGDPPEKISKNLDFSL